MKRFRKGKIEFLTAFAGIVLMILTIVWRINPAEGSIVPHFLTGNPLGHFVIYALVATCMPVWILTVIFAAKLPISDANQWTTACVLMIIFQGFVYFLLGKLIEKCVRSIKRLID